MAGEFISFYFHYNLSRKIPFTSLSGNIANVNFVTENDSIIGLDITIQGPLELSKAQAESDAYAFVLSDLILSFDYFYKDCPKFVGVINLLVYYIAQLLIALSVLYI